MSDSEFIARPGPIRQRITDLIKEVRSLRSLLKVSQRFYGESLEEDAPADAPIDPRPILPGFEMIGDEWVGCREASPAEIAAHNRGDHAGPVEQPAPSPVDQPGGSDPRDCRDPMSDNDPPPDPDLQPYTPDEQEIVDRVRRQFYPDPPPEPEPPAVAETPPPKRKPGRPPRVKPPEPEGVAADDLPFLAEHLASLPLKPTTDRPPLTPGEPAAESSMVATSDAADASEGIPGTAVDVACMHFPDGSAPEPDSFFPSEAPTEDEDDVPFGDPEPAPGAVELVLVFACTKCNSRRPSTVPICPKCSNPEYGLTRVSVLEADDLQREHKRDLSLARRKAAAG